MTQTLERSIASDILPTLIAPTYELFIQKKKDEEAFTWTTYTNTFSVHLWLAVMGISVLVSALLTYQYNDNHQVAVALLKFPGNFWMAFKANFGGKSTAPPSTAGSGRLLMFVYWVAA